MKHNNTLLTINIGIVGYFVLNIYNQRIINNKEYNPSEINVKSRYIYILYMYVGFFVMTLFLERSKKFFRLSCKPPKLISILNAECRVIFYYLIIES